MPHRERLLADPGNMARGRVGTALHLKRTDITIEFGGAIAKQGAVVHSTSGMQRFVVRADVDAAPSIPAEIAAKPDRERITG